MNFGIPDLSTGREPASDPTRRRDKAAGSDFAAMLDQSMDAPEEAPRERDPVRTSEPAPAEKAREKSRSASSPGGVQDRTEEDPAEGAAPESVAQESREPSPTEPKQAATDPATTASETTAAETGTAATEAPIQATPAPAQQAGAAQAAPATEPKVPKAAPVDPLAALGATPQATPTNAAGAAETQPHNAAKTPDAATAQPAFAAQLANAAGQQADAAPAKGKAKNDTAPAAEAVAKPATVDAATAAAVAAVVSTASDNRSKNDASDGKPASQPQAAQTVATPAQPAQNPAATQPVPPVDPAADDAQIVAIARAPAQQAATPQPMAPEAAAPLPNADKLPKDIAADTKLTAEPAKSDTPRPFGALAPGLGVAAQITAQQTPEQANAAERLAQLAAAVEEKVAPAAKGDAELAAPKDPAAPALRTEQPPAVDAPVARQAATDVNAVAATARSARPTYHPVVTQVAAQVAQAAADGTDRINIRLSPAELGRIDVKLDFGPDGRVQAVFAAERPQTMELLQRDARDLERALQDAGLRADSGSLSFNLRGNGRDNRDDQAPAGQHQGGGPADAPASQLQAYAAGQGGQGRLDIRI